MMRLETLLLATLLPVLAGMSVAAAGDVVTGQPAYIVLDYRYDPLENSGSSETGHALCATRCNALSFDYADYIMADAREIKRIASGRELVIALDNPFLKGQCLCLVDEYVISPNLRNRPK